MTTRNMQILYKLFMMFALAVVVASCGNNGSQSASTGAITAKLAWDTSGKTTAKTVASAPVGVTTVRIIVSAAGMTTIQKDFIAASGSGTIDGVLAGTGRTLTAQGLDGAGAVIYQGSVSNLSVLAGQTTNAGTIIMAAVGAAPKLSFDLTALTFGPQDNFTTSLPQTVTLSNTGNTGVLLDGSITLPLFGLWVKTNDTCPYTPKVMEAGTNCSVSIAFNPHGQDTLRAGYSLALQLGSNPAPIPSESYTGVFEVHGYTVSNPQVVIPSLEVKLNGTGVYPLSSPVDTTLTFTGAVNFSEGIMTNELMKNDVYATGPDPQTNNYYYLIDGKLANYTSMRRYVRQFSSFGGISYYDLIVDEDTLTHTTILEFYGVKGINTATYRMSGTCIVGSGTTASCASIGINLNRSTGTISFSNTPMFMGTYASTQKSPITLNGTMTFAPF